ncbi:uncharacterized protein LOC127123701 [Lathyrus oleraceus]|uniref:uncharacterized protein LOC127123701 n=1 Tax=Pisum sativum TaxID=3888 RepID=UPI0021D20DD8|nr:uncharacterized protein LOC127123701 [Pisum sativum]
MNPELVILIESRVKPHNVIKFKNKFVKKWNVIDNYFKHNNGRIWILWDETMVKVINHESSSQFIHYSIYHPNGDMKTWLTFIYVINTLDQRKKLWKDIESIHAGIIGPWCLMGDYNNVLKAQDRIGRILVNENKYKDLVDMIEQTGLYEKESITRQLEKAREDLYVAQTNLLQDRMNIQLIDRVKDCTNEVLSLNNVEEQMLKKKSKVEWLRLGDGNNAHFYASLKSKRKQTQIANLKDEAVAMRGGPQLSFEQRDSLIAFIIEKESFTSLKGIKDMSAPSIDGFSVKFFKSTWDNTKHDTINAFKEFFERNKTYMTINCTLVTLIHNTPITNMVKDYRLISCCIVFYKIISRIMAAGLGDQKSMEMVMHAFDEFSKATGLTVNPSKCEVFFGNIENKEKQEIQETTNFIEGNLHFKYLGIPLTSRKLTINYYMPMIEKIVARINHWSSRLLSFAGRTQFIKSVLFALINYWL